MYLAFVLSTDLTCHETGPSYSSLSSTIKFKDMGNGLYFHTDGQTIPVSVLWNLFIENAPSS